MQLGPLDYGLWLTSFLLEAYVVVCSLLRKDFLRYIPLNIYMLAVAGVTWGQYHCISHYGFNSHAYFYYFYYSDGLLYILMYFVIIHFYQQVFVEMNASRYIRSAAALLLVATAFFSYIVVHEHKDHLTTRFVVELEQNLNFVGVVLVYLLWGAILKLRETRTRLIQLVLALGISYSATASAYALMNLFPAVYMLHWVPPIAGVWLPLAWAYTLTKVPEDARLATARLAVGTR
jgi:hypothetical protein